MPWRTGTMHDARARFVLEVEQSNFSFSSLCRRHGISRKTGYKWWGRYRKEGLDGLAPRSHRARTCPHATPEWMEEEAVRLRRRFKWGSKKIRALLLEDHGWSPARSTLDLIFRRHGLVEPSRSRRRREHPGKAPFNADRPNAVWTADFKGEFRTGDGKLCYPLTIQDAYSRYLLEIRALPTPSIKLTRPWFARLFRKHGIPDRIRTDNGPPFASTALGRLSQLSVWWVQLGIHPETIQPGHPSQNGRHERMHRTLKEKAARPPSANLKAQQARFRRFRKRFNHVRPHESLGQQTPASWWTPPERRCPRSNRVRYPGHFELRKVAGDKTIRWHNTKIFLSSILVRETVGFEEIGDGIWAAYYGSVFLGWLDEDDYRIMDVRGYRRTH